MLKYFRVILSCKQLLLSELAYRDSSGKWMPKFTKFMNSKIKSKNEKITKPIFNTSAIIYKNQAVR